MFRKNAKKNFRNVDKIVTWVIIGSAVASIFWIKKISATRKSKAAWEKVIVPESEKTKNNNASASYGHETWKSKMTLLSLLWKILILPLKPFKKNKK